MNKYKTKAAVEKLLGVKVDEQNGNSFYYSGSLDLEGTQITSLPDNLNVGGSLVSEPIGSRKDRTSYHISKDVVHCGCFKGTLLEFEAKVNDTYPCGVFRDEYDAFIKRANDLRLEYVNRNS